MCQHFTGSTVIYRTGFTGSFLYGEWARQRHFCESRGATIRSGNVETKVDNRRMFWNRQAGKDVALKSCKEKRHMNLNMIHYIFIDIKYYTFYLVILLHSSISILKKHLCLFYSYWVSLHLFHILVALGDRWHLLNRYIREAMYHI